MEVIFHADRDEKDKEVGIGKDEGFVIGKEFDTQWEEAFSKKLNETEETEHLLQYARN